MSKQLDIILPVYYEQDNIEKVLGGIKKNVKTPYSILLIFQDKKDPTIQIVQKLKKRDNTIQILMSDFGLGVVNALKTGFKKSKAEIITVMMADLSDNPKDIDLMVKKIKGGYDLVCASRYSKNGKRSGGPKIKGFLSFFACWTIRILTGIPTNDSTNAFKTFRKRVIDSITIESVGGFELPLEIVVKSYKYGYKIGEIPTKWQERKKGKSKFKLIKWVPHYIHWYMYALKNKKNSVLGLSIF